MHGPAVWQLPAVHGGTGASDRPRKTGCGAFAVHQWELCQHLSADRLAQTKRHPNSANAARGVSVHCQLLPCLRLRWMAAWLHPLSGWPSGVRRMDSPHRGVVSTHEACFFRVSPPGGGVGFTVAGAAGEAVSYSGRGSAGDHLQWRGYGAVPPPVFRCAASGACSG